MLKYHYGETGSIVNPLMEKKMGAWVIEINGDRYFMGLPKMEKIRG
ncbi:MAG: hypothetical protein VKL02_09935 [Cylindrospermopsis raciborskii 1523720]|nr:hypothetical protein [Cylindrospermopsis raciborskii]MEB3146442.1 hypothetical protein [Cylindrospermopsis raciborskii]